MIEVRETKKGLQRFKDIFEVTEGRVVPEWLEFNPETMQGTVKELPNRDQIDVLADGVVDVMLIVELYSK